MLINITVPVYNEEETVSASIGELERVVNERLESDYELVILDNGSTDGTREVVQRLAEDFPNVRLEVIGQKGRGRAIRQAWLKSRADIVSYMDVDLSTDLKHFPELIEPLAEGEADISIGSRLAKGASVERGLKREILSRGYNRLIRLMFGNGFSDAQCGFKAMTKGAAETLLPEVKDNEWFFDTELLLKAEAYGYRIAEVPVRWRDDPDSRVKIASTAWKDVAGLIRVKRELREERLGGWVVESVSGGSNVARQSVTGTEGREKE